MRNCRFPFNHYIVDIPRWTGVILNIYIIERNRAKTVVLAIVYVTYTHVAECLLTLSVIEKWCVVVRVERANGRRLCHISRNKITFRSVCREKCFFLGDVHDKQRNFRVIRYLQYVNGIAGVALIMELPAVGLLGSCNFFLFRVQNSSVIIEHGIMNKIVWFNRWVYSIILFLSNTWKTFVELLHRNRRKVDQFFHKYLMYSLDNSSVYKKYFSITN